MDPRDGVLDSWEQDGEFGPGLSESLSRLNVNAAEFVPGRLQQDSDPDQARGEENRLYYTLIPSLPLSLTLFLLPLSSPPVLSLSPPGG